MTPAAPARSTHRQRRSPLTTQVATAPPTPARSRRRALLTAPAIAGITFVAAWIAEPTVWPTIPRVTESTATVASSYARHQGEGA
jgi:hypothetical protein